MNKSTFHCDEYMKGSYFLTSMYMNWGVEIPGRSSVLV